MPPGLLRGRRWLRCVGWFSGGEHFRFALEPSEPVGVAPRTTRGRILIATSTLQLRISRPIHLPHAAFADLGGDFVDAEAGAGGEGQTVELYERSDCADGFTPS